MKFLNCNLNSDYLSSCKGISSLIVLASGGGIFGMIARNSLHVNNPSGEALLWVAVFGWVTTLFDFLWNIQGKTTMSAGGRFAHTLIMTVLYIVTTVCWGVYGTFPVVGNSSSLVIFVLAIITTLTYLEQASVSLCEYMKSCPKKSAAEPAESDAVVENGKSEDAEQKEDTKEKKEED